MSYLIFYYFFIICICNNKTTSSSKELKNYDIDDFINKLLASKKFDELTDIVAEKAIKGLKGLITNSEYDLINKNLEDLSHKSQERHNDYESKVKRDENIVIRTDVEAEDIKPEKDLSKKVNEAIHSRNYAQKIIEEYDESDERQNGYAIENRAQDTTQLLSTLQDVGKVFYTATPNDNRASNNSEKAEKLGLPKAVQPNDNFNSSYNKKYEKLSFINQQEVTINENDYNDDEFEESLKETKLNEEYNLKLQLNNYSNIQEENENVKTLPSLINRHKTVNNSIDQNEKVHGDLFKSISYEDNFVPNEKLSKDDYDKNMEANNVWIGNDDGITESDNNNEDISMITRLVTDKSTTERKQIIRREGDRLYTYLTGPEYAEFHEELEKMEAERKKHQFHVSTL